MKLNETQMHKNIGSIQMCRDEDGVRFYAYTHFASGNTSDDDTIKGAKEMLEWEEKNYQEVQAAIRVLAGRGYRVFKEIA
jgi:hypothetical protein